MEQLTLFNSVAWLWSGCRVAIATTHRPTLQGPAGDRLFLAPRHKLACQNRHGGGGGGEGRWVPLSSMGMWVLLASRWRQVATGQPGEEMNAQKLGHANRRKAGEERGGAGLLCWWPQK